MGSTKAFDGKNTNMKAQIAFLLFWSSIIPTAGQVVITPSTPPVVNQGAIFQFTANIPVRWSMAPGAKGTVDPISGVYIAPSVVDAQQSYAGCQVLPNDHIYNTRIDSLPVNPHSAAWIAGAGTVPFSYEIGLPVNVVNSETPTQNMAFYYTRVNNGSFVMPQYPSARIESGWFTAPFGGGDRHLLTVDPTLCSFQDIYDPYIVGSNSQCPACTAQSGVKYSGATYDLASNGGTDAAGLYITPLLLKLQELENAVATRGTIKHALRFTLNQGYCASANIWPAQTFASDGGTVPFGSRFRLKSSFNSSGFSPIAQILLTQLKQYGLILADGGTGWASQPEYTDWPAVYQKAFQEIRYAAIAPTNFEAVDESGLMVSSTSGATTASETVVATSISNPGQTASQQIVLRGVTLNLPRDQIYIQAGAAAQQLVSYVNGSSNTSATWSMTPIVGTLTEGGLYTPPPTEGLPMTATITATSTANSSVYATETLTVLPSGPIRLYSCSSASYILCSSNYTDTLGNTWFPLTGADGGYPYNNGGTWPSIPNITLYQVPFYSFGNDIRFDITVPNGMYSIMEKFASTNVGAPGQLVSLEAQGQVAYQNVDIYARAGGSNLPVDFTLPATVSNGQLSLVLRRVAGSFNDISALQIVPILISPNGGPLSPPTGLKGTVE